MGDRSNTVVKLNQKSFFKQDIHTLYINTNYNIYSLCVYIYSLKHKIIHFKTDICIHVF